MRQAALTLALGKGATESQSDNAWRGRDRSESLLPRNVRETIVLQGGVAVEKIKWFAYAAVMLLSSFFVGLPISAMRGGGRGAIGRVLAHNYNLLGTPMAIGVTILKYRPYDVDLLINIRGAHRVSG